MSTWAAIFFTVWWINTIISLFKRKFSLAFNAVFQMFVVGQFVSGLIPVNVGSVIGAIVGCWLAFMLSLIPTATGMARSLRPDDADDGQEFTASLFEDIYFQRADVNHKPEAIEVVRLLIEAGIGVGKYEGYPRPPTFWRKPQRQAINSTRGYNRTPQHPVRIVLRQPEKSWI